VKRNSTESLWIEQSSRSTYPVLKGKTEVDVAIIGAGITGLTAAILLKQAGRSVAVLDSHHVGTGESGHTTAHLTEFIDRGYAQLISDFGLEGAQMAAQSSRTSIEQIYNLMKSLKIECGFERLPGYI
jgi:glycine/D-amino acid oxidase-like deaminating enzyme